MLFLNEHFCAQTHRYECIYIYLHFYNIAYLAALLARDHCCGSAFLSVCALAAFSLVYKYSVLVCT